MRDYIFREAWNERDDSTQRRNRDERVATHRAIPALWRISKKTRARGRIRRAVNDSVWDANLGENVC